MMADENFLNENSGRQRIGMAVSRSVASVSHIPCMNVDQAAFHLLAPFTDMPMRCLPEFSFKQHDHLSSLS
jgi:hypothetical protein